MATIYGTDGDDIITGTAEDDLIVAQGGNDTVDAGAGNDTITGGLGNDTLNGGTGNDTYLFYQGDGVDTLQDTVVPDEGNQIVFGSGITLSSLSLGVSSGSLVIRYGGNGDEIHIAYFDPNDAYGPHAIDTLQFADGTALTYSQLIDRGFDIAGTAGDDTITGTNAMDRITGLAGNDLIQSGAGNDLLDGGSGADTMGGGAGNDTYIVEDPGDVVTENVGGGTDTVQSSISYALSPNVENLTLTGINPINGTGNELNNVLIGNTADNVLTGGAGADILDGGAGNDTLYIDANDTSIIGGPGFDRVYVQGAAGVTLDLGLAGVEDARGGDGDDTFTTSGSGGVGMSGNGGSDTLFGGEGNDVLDGGAGADTLVGGGGNDLLHGNDGADQLIGGDGDDTLLIDELDTLVDGGAGYDTVLVNTFTGVTLDLGAANVEEASGNLGNDTFTNSGSAWVRAYGHEGNDILLGGSGVDWLFGDYLESYYSTVGGNDTLDGGAGDDALYGGAGDDVLYGGAGNDLLYGDHYYDLQVSGNDFLDGGTGSDTMIGGKGNDTYVVDDPGDIVQEASGGGTDTVQSSITYTLGSNVENLTLTGTAAINGTGNDLYNTLIGNSGNNVLDGGQGIDTMIGGQGDDTYVLDNQWDVVTESPNEGIDTVQSAFVSYTLSANVENLVLTGGFGINGTGNELNNVLIGNSADNVLDGSVGADTLAGGAGNDTYIVDNVGDVVTDNAGEGTDTVQSSITYTLGANVENLTLTGAGAINGTGNTLSNVLIGNLAANVLDGGPGADTLIGGAGNDTYIMDNVGDVVREIAGEGTDTVQSSINNYTLAANVENLTLTGTAAINGFGNALDNVLIGNGADNVLVGWAGADTLIGGAGNDALYGAFTGADGVDQLDGGDGDDSLYVDATDRFQGGAGRDVVTFFGSTGVTLDLLQATVEGAFGGDGNDTFYTSGTDRVDLNGGAGDDTLTGSSGNDYLTGGAGADVLDGGAGDDNLYIDAADTGIQGGAGYDTVWVQGAAGVTLDLGLAGVEQAMGDAGNDTFTSSGSARIVAFGGAGNDTLIGGAGNDSLFGEDGADQLIGGVGDDFLYFDANDTLIDGGAGNDWAYVYGIQDPVTLDLGAANVEQVIGGEGNDTFFTTGGGAIWVSGYEGDDTITGGIGDDMLAGDEGNDTLIGGAGNDTLSGLWGNDFLDGGAGNDTLYIDAEDTSINGGTGYDTAWVVGASGVTLDLGQAGIEAAYGGSGNDIFTTTGTAAVTEQGNGGNDWLAGGSGADNLYGGDGADTLNGGGGADYMAGGTGDDRYVVDNATDIVSEEANAGTDTVESSVTYTLSSNVENLVLTGTAAIRGTGNALNNVLAGNNAANSLSGGDGNDTLVGGPGNDTLNGGIGNDTFIFVRGDGQDIVQDSSGNSDAMLFSTGINPIDLVLSRQGKDLRLAIHGSSDRVTIQNWYFKGTSNQTETIQASDGERLLNTQVDQLIQAMANYSAQTGLTWDQAIDQRPQDVQTILAANWH